MGRAQVDRKMGKRIRIEDMTDGMVKKEGSSWMRTGLCLFAIMALVLMAVIASPSNAWAALERLYATSGVSNYNGWTWTNNYSDWLSSDGDTTIAYTSTDQARQTVHVDNSQVGMGVIDNVVVKAECKQMSGGEKVSLLVVDGYIALGTSTAASTGTTYTTYSNTWTTRPYDSTAWQWTDIDKLEIGVQAVKQGGGFDSNLNCTYVYAEVNYHFEIDNLTVSINNAVATSAMGGDSNVLMQTVGVGCDTSGNSECIVTSITINDMGIATDNDWANLHLYLDSDQSLTNGTLGTTTTAGWDGTFTEVDVTNMPLAARTITNAEGTQYIHVVYDLNQSAGGKSIQSRVAEVNVAGTDIGAANTWSSYSFPVVEARDTLTFISNTPVATSAYEGEPSVKMQRLAVSCDSVQNGECVITSLRVDDVGSAYNGDITQSYIHIDDDTDFNNGTLGTATGGSWNGGAKTIDITGMPLSARTITNAEGTQYIWLVYDVADNTGEETIQSYITKVNVASPDNGIEGNHYSNLITIDDTDDHLTMSASGQPTALGASAGETDVHMQTVAVDCDYNADGQCAMTTVTVEDTGDGGAWGTMYLLVDDNADYGDGVLSTATYNGWNGSSTDVSVSRTVSNGDTDYIHVIYDLAGGTQGKAIRSVVTNIAVSGTDVGATNDQSSNPITIQANADIDTISYCADCHNMPILDGTRSASSVRGGSRAVGNHASVIGHMPSSPSASDCAVCHVDHGSNMNHKDGMVNMASAINTGTYQYGTSLVQNTNSGTRGICSNTRCHGVTSPPWGSSLSAYDTCTKCHGTKTANPETWQLAPGNGGVDTAGDYLATDPQVGAHYEHLAAPLNTAAGVTAECETCHLKPATMFATGHVDSDSPAEMNYNAFVQNYGFLTPKRSGNTCANTYCHGNRMPTAGYSGDGADTSPGWLNADYLTGTDLDHDCSRCHGFPPKSYANSEHESMTDYAAKTGGCHICHQYLNDPLDDNETGWKDGNAFAEPKRHINGRLEVAAACDGCHGYPPNSDDNHGYIAVEGKGVHMSHVEHLETAYSLTRDPDNDQFGDSTVYRLCKTCHYGAVHQQTGVDSGNNFRTIAFNSADFKFGTSPPTYFGVQNSPGATNPKTCSNISCHYITSPEWEQWP